jgi:hypothetical protein
MWPALEEGLKKIFTAPFTIMKKNSTILMVERIGSSIRPVSKNKRQSLIDFPFFEEDIMNPIPRDYFTRSKTLGARFL